MSFQQWDSSEDAEYRLPGCGHLVSSLPHGASQYSCPVCGESHSLKKCPPIRNLIPAIDLTWPQASNTKCLELVSPVGKHAEDLLYLEDLVAAISTDRSSGARLDLSRKILRLRQEISAQGPALRSFWVLKAITSGVTICQGSLELPEGVVLLLTGHGAHFKGTTFTGGIVMCAGAAFSGSFENCTFNSTTAYAVHAAAVVLCGCSFRDAHPGLTASGGATHATVTRCLFRGCTTAVLVVDGAAADVFDSTMTSTTNAVVVNAAGSCARLELCTLEGGSGTAPHGRGVVARCGAVHVLRCELCWFHTAIFGSLAGTCVHAREVRIRNGVGAVDISRGARAFVKECALHSQSASAHAGGAVVAVGSPAADCRVCMAMERVTVQAGSGRAVQLDGGSAFAATLCHLQSVDRAALHYGNFAGTAALLHCTGQSASTCLFANGAATNLRLYGGEYSGPATACLAQAGATLHALETVFRSRRSRQRTGVVSAVQGVRARLCRCGVHEGVNGVMSGDSDLRAVDLRISDMLTTVPFARKANGEMGYVGGAGILVTGGTADIRGGCVERCVLGVEAQAVRGTFGRVSVRGTTVLDCVTGMEVNADCEAHVADCEFLGPHRERGTGERAPDLSNARTSERNADGIGFKGDKGGSVIGCTVTGYYMSLYSNSPEHVSFSNCEVTVCQKEQDHAQIAGAVFRGRSNVSLEKCRFRGLHEMSTAQLLGVRLEESAQCCIRDCDLQGFSGSAISVGEYKSAPCMSARVVGTRIRGGPQCRDGVTIQLPGSISMQDCDIRDVETGVQVIKGVFNAKRTTISGRSISVEVLCDAGTAAVKLVDSELIGGGIGIVAAGRTAEVSLLRCTIRDASRGATVCAGALMRISKTGAVGAKSIAFEAGDRHGELGNPNPCDFCGRSGESARVSAFEALSRCRSSAGVLGARCPHEGALARMNLTDSFVKYGQNIGVGVHVGGWLEATRVTVQTKGFGFSVNYVVVPSVFRECVAVGCWRASSAERWLRPDAHEEGVDIPEIHDVTSLDDMGRLAGFQ